MNDEQVTTTDTTKSTSAQPKKDDATQYANTARRRPVPIHCECGD